MRHQIFTAVITAVSIFTLSGVAVAGSKMHVDIAKKHCDKMIVTGEKALDQGGQGHPDVALKHFKEMVHEAEECLVHGQEGIKASDASEATKAHGPEAMEMVEGVIDHGKTAIKQGSNGNTDSMMNHGQEALMHAFEAVTHANEMH